MMIRLLLILILALCPFLPADGRLGETLEECKVRYGEVVWIERSSEDYPQYCFRKGDIEIRVRLVNNRSGEEIFTAAYEHRMSQSQIDEILAANSNGSTWQRSPSPSPEAQDKDKFSAFWNLFRADRRAYGEYVVYAHIPRDVLTLESFEFYKAFHAPGSGF
jgi:hypothetical protein